MNYITKHWRGELSLKVSFWINVVLVNLICKKIPSNLITYDNFHPQTLYKLITVLIIFCLTILPWQVVGLWRSSNMHYQETGRRFWASTVKALIILGVLRAFGEIGPQILILKKSFQLGFTKDKFSNYQITIEKNGELLKISGTLGFGFFDNVEKYFENNKKIKGILLDSSGGRIYEARKLSDLIISKNIDTYVVNNCQSACTIVFISGKHRYVDKKANLGFHAYTHPFEDINLGKQETEDEQKNDLKLFRRQGVSEIFLNRIYHADNNDMWYPSYKELVSYNVINGLIKCSEIDSENCWSNYEKQKELILEKYPFFRNIKKYKPKLHDTIMSALEAKLDSGSTRSGLHEFSKELFHL